MFQREGRWMLLRFALMVAVAWVLAMVIPPLLRRRTGEPIGRDPATNAERCDAGGGIWDAHHGECHDDDSAPPAMERYGVPDRPPKRNEDAGTLGHPQ